jgi:hypothetical protein
VYDFKTSSIFPKDNQNFFTVRLKSVWLLGTGGSRCNPGYSGGRGQEDCGLRPAGANSSWDPILKKTITKK